MLAEEGYPGFPRRSRLKLSLTVQGAGVPEVSQVLAAGVMRKLDCDSAGVFLFALFIERLNLAKVVDDTGLPVSKMIPALQYFLSFLALKLIGTERFTHMSWHQDSGNFRCVQDHFEQLQMLWQDCHAPSYGFWRR